MRYQTSLRTRLLLLVALAVGSAQVVITGLTLWQETTRYAETKRDTLLSNAHVLAAAVAQGVARKDRGAIFQTLRAIGDIKGLMYVGVADSNGVLLGDLGATERLQSDLTMDESSGTIPLGALLTTRSIEMAVPIVHAGVTIGVLRLVGDATDLAAQLAATLKTACVELALAIAVASLIAWKMQGGITRPLRLLTSAMERVSTSHDYSLSLAQSSVKELGILIGGFNKMLSDIKERDARIAASHAYLEEQVAERTIDLREAKEAAETATAQKSDFLATMSHEIRTPMNGMLVMAELLVGADLPARARRYADVIARSGQSLLAIINDILDFSKIEAGKLDLERVPIDLAEASSTVMDLFCEKARGQGLDLASRVAIDLPAIIHGDPVRLNQVLGNFINNALKFTATGGVRLEIDRDPTAPECVRFAVVDSGIGIPADKIETVFGAFSQADQSTTRRYGGTGLGLAICRKLVLAMGSEIKVTSEVGVGSTFSFSIPLDTSEAAAPWPRLDTLSDVAPKKVLLGIAGDATRDSATYYCDHAGFLVETIDAASLADSFEGAALGLLDADICTPALIKTARRAGCRVVALTAPGETAKGEADAAIARPLARRDMRDLLAALVDGKPFAIGATSGRIETGSRFQGARALVADDNPVNREVAGEALSRLGMIIEMAEDGAEAVAAFEARRFDIIFMDGSMPVLDGFEATRRIRAIEAATETPPVPIIALTAHVIGTSSTEWFEAGMNALLHKPFTLKALSDCVAGLLTPVTAEGVAEAPAPEVCEPEAADPMADLPVIDEKTMAELRGFAASGRHDFVARVIGLYLAHAPKGAQDIATQAGEGRLEAVAKSGHALKSMSLNIGARRVAALASEIEAEAKRHEPPDAATIARLGDLIDEACALLAAEIAAEARTAAIA